MSNEAEALLSWCESEKAWVRRTVETLLRLESPSTDKAAVDRCGAEIAARLREIGGRVDVLRQTERGDHLRAEFAGGPGQVMLLGHFDTVWPVGQIERMPIREEAGRLHGPGVFDMKAAIAVAMLAMRALHRGAEPACKRSRQCARVREVLCVPGSGRPRYCGPSARPVPCWG